MSPVMVVYRVEHKERGEGPFCGEAVLRYGDKAWDMPTPGNDRRQWPHLQSPFQPARWMTAHRHACRSMFAIRKWFYPSADKLRAAGFVVRRYRVPIGAMEIFRRQVIFDPDLAVTVGTQAIKAKR